MIPRSLWQWLQGRTGQGRTGQGSSITQPEEGGGAAPTPSGSTVKASRKVLLGDRVYDLTTSILRILFPLSPHFFSINGRVEKHAIGEFFTNQKKATRRRKVRLVPVLPESSSFALEFLFLLWPFLMLPRGLFPLPLYTH